MKTKESIMKKTYQKPAIEAVEVELETIIAMSPSREDEVGFGKNNYDATLEILGKERGDVFGGGWD